jgi:glutamate-5-semialdehyde dehydrogenase
MDMDLNELGRRAKQAAAALNKLNTEEKNRALQAAADALTGGIPEILAANLLDMEAGKKSGMSEGLLDRLKLDEKRIRAMAEGLLKIAELPDPVGEILSRDIRPNGLLITKVRVPIGVIGIIYEARPNVTSDAFGLCFKSGNATVLRGGSAALHSCTAIAEKIRTGLRENGFPEDAVQLISDTSRDSATALMHLNEYVDCLIPRGSAGLIRAVKEESTVPVIETGSGNCHIYVDESADIPMAVRIAVNAKTQRVGVCNAAESIVVHEKALPSFLPPFAKAMAEHHVEVRADEAARKLVPAFQKAAEEDWGKEYLDYIISVRTVGNIDQAIAHINRYNTGHSETIVTENPENAERFLNEIDAACVYVNASTRFTDGGEFGFGGEIGISTQKLHARGPMGLRELTSYKYQIRGNGQIRP